MRVNKTIRLFTSLTPHKIVASVSVLLLIFSIFIKMPVSAADLDNRSITIGSSLASDVTTHSFRFTTATAANVGSIVYEYCSNLPFYGVPCTIPTGLDTDSVSIASQTGITGFAVDALTTSNRIVVSRAAAFENAATVNMRFSNVTNQSTATQTVYVRIAVYSTTNGSGSPVDFGAVVYSTVPGVGVGGYVPPYLTFCVGVTVASDCSSTDGSLMTMGEFSTSDESTSTSQFAAATNDPSGYDVYMSGGTMTSGNEIIPSLATATGSVPGTSQFGVNLRANSNPSLGSNISGSGTGTAASGYGTSNSFRYNDGERIAGTNIPTNFNRYTVSYIVNVSEDQRPGIYASSFTFTAIASF